MKIAEISSNARAALFISVSVVAVLVFVVFMKFIAPSESIPIDKPKSHKTRKVK